MDTTQQRLTDYAHDLRMENLTPEAIQAAKVTTIDALGAMLCGFAAEPSRIAREVAVRMLQPDGATVIGTGIRASPDMAAFVNATAAACDDSGSGSGSSTSVVAPILAAAEYAHASGRNLLVAVALGEAVYRRVADGVGEMFAFCPSNVTCVASALAAGKAMGLSREQLAQTISLAAVTSVTLDQRDGGGAMWDAFAAGTAGRAGLFAALTARQGMEGPVRPFEGKTGWFDQVAGSPLAFDALADGPVGPIEPTAAVEARFRRQAATVLSKKQARAVLDIVWNMDTADDVAIIAAALVIA